MKTALVHDWLLSHGGAEKVLSSIHKLYKSPIYTLFYEAKKMEGLSFAKEDISSSFLQKIPFSSKLYRHLLPLYPKAIESFNLSAYDLILSSSYCAAKSIKKTKKQLHICYCHTPMRFIWDLEKTYLDSFPYLVQKVATPCFKRLRKWDLETSVRVDAFIANSYFVAERIERIYQRKATVIYPPVATEEFILSRQKESYYITHARLVPYKRIDLLVKAFQKLPSRKLLIVGSGPEEASLKKLASSNVEFLGYVSQTTLIDLLSKAKAYLFAAEEDFGISLVEAAAAGLPVICLKKGGALETVLDGKTGLFFEESKVESLLKTIDSFEKKEDSFNPLFIQEHAKTFNKERFETEFKAFVEKKAEDFFV